MPIYVAIDGMGPSDRTTFAVGDTQPSDLLTAAPVVDVEERIVKRGDGSVEIEGAEWR